MTDVGLAEPDFGHAEAGLGGQHRGQQRLRVGMTRRPEQGLDRPVLDDTAEIHDRDLGCDMLDHCQIVADEHIGQAEVAAQLGEQVQDLRLDRYVERRGRLVAHDDPRLQHQGTGDRHPLALTARQLAREAVGHVRRKANAGELRGDAVGDGAGRQSALRDQRQADHVAHPPARIERPDRILEHRLDHTRALTPAKCGERLAADPHLAGRRRQQTQDQPGEGGLAAAGLADHAKYAARRKAQGDVVDRGQHALRAEQRARQSEALRQAPDVDEAFSTPLR